ncbi:unnamed protein product, partial [Prorocentrum cordatum]
CFFIHPQRAAAASSQGPATGSPNARTAFGGGGGGGGGQGEEGPMPDDQGGAGKSTPMPAFEKRRRDPAGIYKGPRNHLRGVWDRQPAPLSVGMQMALMTRELLSGLGAHRIPGNRCRMLLSRLDAHRIPRQLHASEDEQEEQRRSGRRTRKMMTRTRNYTTTKPCDPADAAQAARVPGIATKQLRATHNLQPAIPMRWGRIPHAG